MTTQTDCRAEVEDLNAKVIAAHHAHYEKSPHGLIDTSENASPNENTIYHLYNDGEITQQKGAYAYLQRSEFDIYDGFLGKYHFEQFPFDFVVKARTPFTYAVLTLEECIQFRKEMYAIVQKYRE